MYLHGDGKMAEGWNYLFFPLLLGEGDPDTFIEHLRNGGFDATRFHAHVPTLSFPELSRERFPKTFTLVDRLVCLPNSTRMPGQESRLGSVVEEYFRCRSVDSRLSFEPAVRGNSIDGVQ